MIGESYEMKTSEDEKDWILVEVVEVYDYTLAPSQAVYCRKVSPFHKTVAVKQIGIESPEIRYCFDFELQLTDKVIRIHKLNKILNG